MRVIAGKFGSRRLRTLRGMALRPTSDRTRETLFDILGDSVKDSLFVDLFAGSGAVGIEALSRGAHKVFLIESHRAAIQLIGENLDSLGVGSEAEVMGMGAVPGLAELADRHILADFIFLDPPYAQAAEYHRVLETIDARNVLSPNGRVIAEHRAKLELRRHWEKIELSRVVKQGDSALSFYRLALAA